MFMLRTLTHAKSMYCPHAIWLNLRYLQHTRARTLMHFKSAPNPHHACTHGATQNHEGSTHLQH